MTNKIKIVILGNELKDDHKLWIKACNEYKTEVEYRVVDLTKNFWLEKIQLEKFDILLAKPSGVAGKMKQLYDERIYILSNVLKYKLFPSNNEIFIYENKRFLSFWLKANKLPHPRTDIFYQLDEARNYLNTTYYPIVAKSNIGASGSGVVILRNQRQALSYIIQAYHGKGAKQRIGPNFLMGSTLKRGVHYIFHPQDIIKKINIYKLRADNIQKGFVIFQEYIPHDFEWRVVRIGNSFFAHKKIKKGDKASGMLLKRYENPPYKLLDFVKVVTDQHRFFSQAIDIFENKDGYLINEMQCIFGQSDPYQMLVDGEPGRYVYLNGKWIFEKGDFTKNECFNLRIKHVLSISDG
jgi:glutathione synthase/RimK-type ligase-like ATP-grasp enzyme